MNLSERQIEDYVTTHLSEIFWPEMRLIARQVQLQHGRADVLCWDDKDGRVVVIELKAVPLDENDVAQVLRYSADILEAMQFHWANLVEPKLAPLGTLSASLSNYHYGYGADRRLRDTDYAENLESSPIMPMLIGTGLKPNASAAATAGNVYIRIARHEGGNLLFEVPEYSSPVHTSLEAPHWLSDLAHWVNRYVARTADSLGGNGGGASCPG